MVDILVPLYELGVYEWDGKISTGVIYIDKHLFNKIFDGIREYDRKECERIGEDYWDIIDHVKRYAVATSITVENYLECKVPIKIYADYDGRILRKEITIGSPVDTSMTLTLLPA